MNFVAVASYVLWIGRVILVGLQPVLQVADSMFRKLMAKWRMRWITLLQQRLFFLTSWVDWGYSSQGSECFGT